MKKIFLLACVASLLCGCGRSASSEEKTSTVDSLLTTDVYGSEDSVASEKTEEAGSSEQTTADEKVSSAEIDEFLNDYAKLMSSLVKLNKKVAQGDLSALTDYSELMSTLSDLQEKLEAKKSSFTEAQLERLNKLLLESTELRSK